jgi:glycosyltransferase involved in cell wall biosynthesis
VVARVVVTTSAATPALSVVICTRNRAATLPETLRRYPLLVTTLAWELVAVDNGSSDGTRAVLDSFAASAPFPMRVVSEPRKGLSRARNRGWREARAEIVVFTDDDCYPEPDFLDRVHECFTRRPIDYLGGRILLFDPDDLPVTVLRRETPVTLEPGVFIDTGVIQGANMSTRRRVLETLGGFDEMLGAGTPWCSEDVDFIGRAAAAGFAGAYDPAPVVLHHHRRRAAGEVRELNRTYDIGRGAYYMKCLLDSRRRSPGWAAFRASLAGHLSDASRSRRNLLRVVYELQGALGYLLARVTRPTPSTGGAA